MNSFMKVRIDETSKGSGKKKGRKGEQKGKAFQEAKTRTAAPRSPLKVYKLKICCENQQKMGERGALRRKEGRERKGNYERRSLERNRERNAKE